MNTLIIERPFVITLRTYPGLCIPETFWRCSRLTHRPDGFSDIELMPNLEGHLPDWTLRYMPELVAISPEAINEIGMIVDYLYAHSTAGDRILVTGRTLVGRIVNPQGYSQGVAVARIELFERSFYHVDVLYDIDVTGCTQHDIHVTFHAPVDPDSRTTLPFATDDVPQYWFHPAFRVYCYMPA